MIDFIVRRARDTSMVNIRPAAALTKGLQGREMAEIGRLKEAGAIAFTDGARSVTNAQVMRRALTYARDFDALIGSIRQKLWPLGDDVAFISGHGPMSTFGDERSDNPFCGDRA